jgi:PTS system nitrogen regulatory IIA component
MYANDGAIQFLSFFQPTQVICQTKQNNRDAVLLELLRLLAHKRDIGSVEEAYKAVLERENDIPTIVGRGIAMPHVRLDALDNIIVGMATSKKGIIYAGRIDNPIKLIILTLIPKKQPGVYLRVVSSLAKICQDPASADIIAELPTPEDVWRFFDRDGIVLPAHPRVGDIMEAVVVKLQEHDTLEQAIDLFVRYGLTELPVVDKDNNLVGVVTTYELLRVCLPDYILWMEDLTPILNFETFKEILHKESRTWLADIMTSEHATLEADAPAIQVAKEIIHHKAGNVFVVQGPKLVGVISLVTFLSRVLRE